MPIWTFTSGPNKGKRYHGSKKVDDDARESESGESESHMTLARVKQMIKSGHTWGKIVQLKCNRNLERVKSDPKAYSANFEVVKMRFHEGELCEDQFLARFEDIPIVLVQDVQEECGEPVVIESNIQDGDLIEVCLLSDFTCAWKKMTESNLAYYAKSHKRRLQKERIEASPLLYVTSYRDIGNKQFKSGMYYKAIESYTMAIEHVSAKHKVHINAEERKQMTHELIKTFANRALAYLKLKKFHEAEKDCNEAFDILEMHSVETPLRVKLLFRRATARYELKYCGEALDDLELLLKLEEDNASAKQLMEKINEMDDEEPNLGIQDNGKTLFWDENLNAPRWHDGTEMAAIKRNDL